MLKGYTQLAVMKNSDPVVGDFLKKIERSADGINHQIAFTKTYQELGVQSPSWFRLDALIAATEASEIQISDTCRNTEIFADPMVERVFFNLVDNARRHGGNVTTIAIRCEWAADDLVIIIEDNGIGIAPEEKEKIFNKGYGKGSGFGLFLAREILAITEITLRETGYLGIGARFEITVPANRWRAVKDQ
jgi:signal transduction histidine kinase